MEFYQKLPRGDLLTSTCQPGREARQAASQQRKAGSVVDTKTRREMLPPCGVRSHHANIRSTQTSAHFAVRGGCPSAQCGSTAERDAQPAAPRAIEMRREQRPAECC